MSLEILLILTLFLIMLSVFTAGIVFLINYIMQNFYDLTGMEVVTLVLLTLITSAVVMLNILILIHIL